MPELATIQDIYEALKRIEEKMASFRNMPELATIQDIYEALKRIEEKMASFCQRWALLWSICRDNAE
ncbi:MAG: hypothetical protein HXS46_15460 [Theionarchaea archaeon]|nr:hypothetical protein [Theionarchaea archaeon]